MKRVLRDNSLSLVMFGLFAVFQAGLFFAGHQHYNNEQREHGQPAIGLAQYLRSASFWEATSENWESELLQMADFVIFTAFLFQRGSAESKDPDKEHESDRNPHQASHRDDVPWPVRAGGIPLILYEHSLSLGLLLLFIISFVVHVISGAMEYSNTQIMHGGSPASPLEYLATAQMWFESLQNWQSEFFSVGMIVVLSIFLRQRGSPESKPVDSPHHETGK